MKLDNPESGLTLKVKVTGTYELNDAEREGIRKGREDFKHGRVASEERVEAVLSRKRTRKFRRVPQSKH